MKPFYGVCMEKAKLRDAIMQILSESRDGTKLIEIADRIETRNPDFISQFHQLKLKSNCYQGRPESFKRAISKTLQALSHLGLVRFDSKHKHWLPVDGGLSNFISQSESARREPLIEPSSTSSEKSHRHSRVVNFLAEIRETVALDKYEKFEIYIDRCLSEVANRNKLKEGISDLTKVFEDIKNNPRELESRLATPEGCDENSTLFFFTTYNSDKLLISIDDDFLNKKILLSVFEFNGSEGVGESIDQNNR